MPKKAEIKTKENNASVKGYLSAIADSARRKDCEAIARLMKAVTGKAPKMWGTSIVGFDKLVITSPSGRVVDWMKMGFASRKDAISIYLTCDLNQLKGDLAKLGKYKRGAGCLYFKKLSDIDMTVFKKMLTKSKKLKY